MILEPHVSGFRILRNSTWGPKKGLDILVGVNSAGKSIVLDAVELVTRGAVRGRRTRRSRNRLIGSTPRWWMHSSAISTIL